MLLLDSELRSWDVITVCVTCEGLLACGGNGPEKKERHAQEKAILCVLWYSDFSGSSFMER